MAIHYESLHPLKYYRDYLAHGLRPDGRELDNYRPVIINSNTISSSDGSAIVKIGKTTVVCGIKAELCKPKPTNASEGFLIPNVELPPLCSSKFKSGPPNDQAQTVTKVLFDIIKNSTCFSPSDLCIAKDHLVWCLYADIVCIDYDGSLIDACLLALIAALRTVKLPIIEYDVSNDNKQINLEERKQLMVSHLPVATTFSIFDESILLIDPTAEEEKLSIGLVTVIIKDNKLCSILKPGGLSLEAQKLKYCIKQAMNRSLLLKKLIIEAI